MAAKKKSTGNSKKTAKPRGGSFKPGQSGNPNGRPKIPKEVIEAARAHTDKAIATLVELLDSSNDGVRVKAANALLDRGWGKPQQPIDFTGEGQPIIKVIVETVKAKPNGSS